MVTEIEVACLISPVVDLSALISRSLSKLPTKFVHKPPITGAVKLRLHINIKAHKYLTNGAVMTSHMRNKWGGFTS